MSWKKDQLFTNLYTEDLNCFVGNGGLAGADNQYSTQGIGSNRVSSKFQQTKC